MIERTVLSPTELANLIAAVWSYNQRGAVTNVYFFNAQGEAIELGCVEVMYDGGTLTVRTAPEKAALSPEEEVRRFSQLQFAQAAQNPRLVPPPLSAEQLAALADKHE